MFGRVFVYLFSQKSFVGECGKPDHLEAVGMTVRGGEHLSAHGPGAAENGQRCQFFFSHFVSERRRKNRVSAPVVPRLYAVDDGEGYEQHYYTGDNAVKPVHNAAVSGEYLAEVLYAQRAFDA